jgi:hypothetical protein
MPETIALLVGRQTVDVGAVPAYSCVASGIIGLIVDKAMGFRIDAEHEVSGIDLVVHAETAYDLHATAGARSSGHQQLSGLPSGPSSQGSHREGHQEEDE